jgi:hypothetical protein
VGFQVAGLTDFKKYARLHQTRQRLKLTSLKQKENIKDAGRRWNQRCQDVLLRYAAKDTGIFP